MNRDDAIKFLTAHGNLSVPCSRYGRDSDTCTPVAWDAAVAFEDATGDPVTEELLDYIMGLVVNDHDDIAHLLGQEEGRMISDDTRKIVGLLESVCASISDSAALDRGFEPLSKECVPKLQRAIRLMLGERA